VLKSQALAKKTASLGAFQAVGKIWQKPENVGSKPHLLMALDLWISV